MLVAMLVWLLMLVEWFVPVMPGGRPMRAEIPDIYRTDALRNGGVDEIVRVAMETGEYDLVRQVGSDYLFRVRQPR